MRNTWRYGFMACSIFVCSELGGCASDDSLTSFNALATISNQTQPIDVAPQPSKMPWQLSPASTASLAQGERTIIVADPRFGLVKGTPLAVANLDKPIIAFAPRGRIVTACKQKIEPQAKGIGAYSVQAAAAGPAQRNATGETVQQVFFRIIYDRPTFLEVRQAALLCTVDIKGVVLDAHPV